MTANSKIVSLEDGHPTYTHYSPPYQPQTSRVPLDATCLHVWYYECVYEEQPSYRLLPGPSQQGLITDIGKHKNPKVLLCLLFPMGLAEV